jgi:hypothetical protein
VVGIGGLIRACGGNNPEAARSLISQMIVRSRIITACVCVLIIYRPRAGAGRKWPANPRERLVMSSSLSSCHHIISRVIIHSLTIITITNNLAPQDYFMRNNLHDESITTTR